MPAQLHLNGKLTLFFPEQQQHYILYKARTNTRPPACPHCSCSTDNYPSSRKTYVRQALQNVPLCLPCGVGQNCIHTEEARHVRLETFQLDGQLWCVYVCVCVCVCLCVCVCVCVCVCKRKYAREVYIRCFKRKITVHMVVGMV